MRKVLTITGDTCKWLSVQEPPVGPAFKEKLVKRADKLELWNVGNPTYEYRLFQGDHIIGVKQCTL